MTNKIALINDTHFGIKNDSPFFLQKNLEYFEKVFFPYIKENNIDTIVHLGDFFDRRKYINFHTLNEVRTRFLEKIDKNVTFHIILGNHDTFFKNTNEVNSLKELLRGYPNIIVHDKVITTELKGLSVTLVPWINDNNKTEYMDCIKNSNSSIVMGHFEIAGFEVIDGVKHPCGISKHEFTRFEMVISGHFHIKQTIDNIYYLGTQYQMSFGDVSSRKGFHILDTSTRELTFIENEDAVFNIIYYDDSFDFTDTSADEILENFKNTFIKVVVRCKTKPFIFDKFMDKLYNIPTQEITVIEDYGEKTVNSIIDVSEDTLSIINKEIDDLQNDLNKDKLKLIVKDLYMESNLL